MELQNKQDHIIRCIRAGMDLESAMFCAECSFDEMDEIQDNDAFLYKVSVMGKLEEFRLLEDFELGSKIAASKGNTAPIQWKLAHMNPGRWGNSNKDEGDEDRRVAPEIYLPSNGRENVS